MQHVSGGVNQAWKSLTNSCINTAVFDQNDPRFLYLQNHLVGGKWEQVL